MARGHVIDATTELCRLFFYRWRGVRKRLVFFWARGLIWIRISKSG
uniref:Uncharacterized protein n=1 Tax=Klebsiella pneumoniae TaxID=573 RepID=A0A8B0SWH6_KLEPN|nr:hypothetical protein [Klebsiella pneumoniae]